MENIRKFINIVSEETPFDDVDYNRGPDKVTATVSSHNSAVYTKLAQKVLRMEELEKEIKQLRSEVKEDVRIYVADLFEAEDNVRTRVVDTIKFILTLSKNPKETETVQYAKVLKELEKHLTPNLLHMLMNIKAQFTSIVQKSPSLKIASKDESINEGVSDNLKAYTRKFLQFIQNWGEKYDRKLSALMSQVK